MTERSAGAARRREAYSYRSDAQVPGFPDDRPLIVFDGICVLCSGSARFVLRHDPEKRYRLLAAQAPLGRALYRHYGLDPETFGTILLIEDGRLRTKSDAALRIAARLAPPWPAAAALRVVPALLRDWVYDLVARRRFDLFGRRDTCLRPEPRDAERFLE